MALGRQTSFILIPLQRILRDAVNYPPGLHLKPTSKAKNSGDPGFTKGTGETDIDGDSRIKDGRVNCGADE